MKRALLLFLLVIPSALAHAEPYHSDPPGGSRLEVAPESVSVDFTEPVHRDGSWLRVVDQDGDRVDNDDLVITGQARPRMEITLQDIPDGAYSIRWQTFSESDGHTIRGSIGFAVGGFAPPTTTTDAEDDVDLFPALARAVLYAGIALGIGAMMYTRFVTRGALVDLRWSLRAGAGAALGGTFLLAFDSWRETGLALGAFLQGPAGADYLWRLALVAVALAWTWLARIHVTIALPWAAFTWMTASFGHITREGLWAIGLEWLHLIAAATWIGGLFLFMLSLRQGTSHGARFTHLAQWAVIGLVVSGTVITAKLTWTVLRTDPQRLFADSWTWFLLAKVSAVVVMLVLAVLNRYLFLSDQTFLHRLLGKPADNEAGLRRTVRLEAGISVLTILAAGLLLSVSPPADDAFDQAPILEQTAQGRAYTGLMRVSPPPEVGQSHVLRFFIAQDGEPLSNNTCGRDDCLRMRWTVDGNASTEQEVALVREGDGWWKAEEVLFIQAGSTAVTVDVQSAYVYLDELAFEPFDVA